MPQKPLTSQMKRQHLVQHMSTSNVPGHPGVEGFDCWFPVHILLAQHSLIKMRLTIMAVTFNST